MKAQNLFSDFFVRKSVMADHHGDYADHGLIASSRLLKNRSMFKPTALLATGLLAIGLVGAAGAQTVPLNMGPNYTAGAQFDCNSLYAVETGQGPANARVFRVDLSPTGTNPNLPLDLIYDPTANTLNNNPMAIAALGTPAGAGGLQMWHLNTTAAAATPATFRYVANGATSGNTWGTVPRGPGTAATSTWSGAEFNRMTGEIVLSAGGAIGANNTAGAGRLGIFNPQTGTIRVSSILSPARGATTVTGTISSDMTTDSDGNIYLIVGTGNTATATHALIRVVPGADNAPWYYNRVAVLTGATVNATKPGMTYLNGKIYFASSTGTGTCGTGRCLIEVDVLSGTMTQRGIMTAATQPIIGNLAACQITPVIQGVLYNDISEEGDTPVPGTTPGIGGVRIEIYKDEGGTPVFKGFRQTDGSGYYSFIIDSTSATYYLRVKPAGLSLGIEQTWAGAGGAGNVTEALCDNGGGSGQWKTAAGPCSSANHMVFGSASQDTVSRVTMTTGTVVANVDFAFSKYTPSLGTLNITLGPNYQSGVQFDCNTLYGVRDTATGGTYRIELDQAPLVNPASPPVLPLTLVYQGRTGGDFAWGASGHSTAALGPVPAGGDIPKSLQMWTWSYAAGWQDFNYVKNGDTVGNRWGQIPLRPGTAPNYTSSGGWSGGEFNQMTGEIVLSPVEGSSLGSTAGNFGIFNPLTGDMIVSNGIVSTSSSDPASGLSYSSDMAIDANGNIYNLVGTDARKYLIRITPGAHGEPWNYSTVMRVTRSSLSPSTSMGTANYGMAFLNGKLYFTNGGTGPLFEINLFTGEAVQRGTYSGSFFDLAACQVAPVLEGTVYDTTGTADGIPVPDETPGAKGIRVDIYKMENGAPVYKGMRVTDDHGFYSFMLDSTSATYFVRVRQPKIGGATFGTATDGSDEDVNLRGVNAAQTWVGVGGDKNIVTAFCVDSAGNTQEVSASGACQGVRRFGSDPMDPNIVKSALANTNANWRADYASAPWNVINDINNGQPGVGGPQILSKVVMTTDREVAQVDFAISAAASYGDAPGQTFKSPWVSGGPAHVLTEKYLWLGNTVATYPDGEANPNASRNTTDDGVSVVLKTVNSAGGIVDEEVPLQNAAMANTKTYPIKAKVNGPYRSQGYLNMWDGGAGAGQPALKTVSTGSQGLQDLANTGEIAFNYATQTTITGGAVPIYTRFRFSTTPGLPAQSGPSAPSGAGEQDWGSTDATKPWVVNGEVEDYRTWQMPALVRLIAVSKGGTATFTYQLNASPQSISSITTVTDGVPLREDSSYVHSVTVNQALTVTQTLPTVTPTNKWEVQSIDCIDTFTGISVLPGGPVKANAVTVPDTKVAIGSDITCIFTNANRLADPAYSKMTVTTVNPPAYAPDAPMIYSGDSYKVTVTALDANNELQPNTTFTVAMSGNNGTITVTSGGVGTYTPGGTPGTGTCTTDATGTCTMIFSGVPASGAAIGSGQQIDGFSATLDGVEIGANYAAPATPSTTTCNPGGAGNNQCSPQSRITTSRVVSVFLQATNPTFNATTQEVVANGTNAAVFQAVMRDANGNDAVSIGGTTATIARATGETLGTIASNTCTVAEGMSGCGSGGATGLLKITSTEAGTVHINATAVDPILGDLPVTGGPITVNFIAGPVDCTTSTVAPSTPTLAADGTSHTDVTVTLKDAQGNLVLTDTKVDFSLPGSIYGSLSATSCQTLDTGSCKVTYTSPSTMPNGATNDVTFNVTATLPCGDKTAAITLTDHGNRNIFVKKTVTSSNPSDKANGYVAGSKFDITVDCPSFNGTPAQLKLADGETSDAVIAKVGETCDISEIAPTPGAGVINTNYTNMAAYPSRIIIASDRNIEVVNTISADTTPTAWLLVKKTVDGGTPSSNHDTTATFEITAVCGTYSAKVSLMAGEQGYIDVPEKTECKIDEPLPPPALNGYKYLPNIKPSAVPSLAAGATETVVVDNIVTGIDGKKVTLTNTVTGLKTESGYTAGGQFTVKLVCGGTTYADEAMKEGYPYSYYVPNNANCTVTTTVSPNLPSDYQWVHTDDLSNPVTDPQNVTVTHEIKGVSDAAYSSLVVSPAGPVLTTSSGYTVTVTAKNASGVTLAGEPIVLTVSGGALTGTGTGTFAGGTCTTDTSGTCVVTWTSTTMSPTGGFTINAKLGGADIGANVPPPTHTLDVATCNGLNTCSPQSREFYTPISEKDSVLATNKTSVETDGSDYARLTVTLKDAAGATTKSIGTTTVNFSKDVSDPGAFSAASCDIPQGESSCYVDISSTVAGTARVTARINTIAVSSTPSPLLITFKEGGVSCVKSTLETSPSTLLADGAATSTVTVTLRDDNGNLILSDTKVDFSLPGSIYGSLLATSCQTGTTGSCYVTYTSPSTMPNGAANDVTFNVTATLPCGAKTSEITLTNSPNRKVTVTKKVNSAGGYVNGKFDIDVACGPAGGPYTSVLPEPLHLADGESGVAIVPVGDTCTLTETVPSGVVAAGYINKATYPSEIIVANDRAITVVNTITQNPTPPYALFVKKTVSGTTAQHNADAMFTINVKCDGDNDSKTVTLMKDEVGHVDVEAGMRCTISEPSVPATMTPNTYKYYPNIAPEVIAKVDSNRTVSVNNFISGDSLGKVTLTNAVTGDPAPSAFDNNGDFKLTLSCGTGYSWTPSMRVGDVWSFYAPSANSCNISAGAAVADRPTITNPLFQWDPSKTTYVPPSGFTVGAGVAETVTHSITGVTDAAYSTLVVTPLGPISTSASYAVTVTANSESGVSQPNTAIVVTVTGGTLAAGGIGNFDPVTGTCTTGASGTCTMVWTSATPSPMGTPPGFTINAKLDGVDIGSAKIALPQNVENCTAANICSPQVRVFYGIPECTATTLMANPTSVDANGTSTSVITVTLKDAQGNLVLTDTKADFSLPSAAYGSLSPSSCQTNATGTCQVTYTSPNAIPPGATGVTVTAQIAGVTCTPAKTAYIAFGESQNQTVTVKKTVEGTGYTGQPFTINVDCGAGYSKVMSLVHGAQDSIVVPIGNTCSISEVEPGAGIIGANNTNTSVIAPWNFTVVKGQDQTVQITNRISNEIIPKGVLNISKHIAGDSSNVDNGHISANEFTINVTCTGTNPATFTLKGGQSAKVEAKLGATCTTDEPAPLPTAKPGYLYAANVSPAVILDLTASRDVTVTNSVEVDDGTPYHWVSLKNVVAGDPALFNNNGMFKLAVGCGTFYEEPEMRVNEESHYSVKQGATCNVSTISRAPLLNTTLWSWGTTTYSPSASFAVNNATNAVATHPIVRTELRTVTVTKTVNDGTGAYTNGKFSINVNCGTGYTKAMTLAGGETDSIDVPINRSCTITEAEPAATVIGAGNSNITTISPSEFTVKDYNDEIKVAVTNRISSVPVNKATLKVTKEVTGTEKSNGHIDGNTFGIVVECTGLLATTLNLQDGWSGTVQGTVGQRCAITEPNLASAPAAKPNYKYVANNTGTVTLQPDVGATPGTQVTVQNMVVPSNVTFHLVSLTNALTADSPTTAYNQGQPFVLTMNCGTGTDYVWNDISGYIGDTTDRSVPAGSTCTMGTASRPTTSATHKWDLGYGVNGTAYNPASGFTVNTAMTETATHRIIPSEMRTIEVVKHVTGGTTASVFAIHVSCNDGAGGAFAPKPVMNLAAGGSSSFQAMDGTYCEVTEDKISIGGVDGYTALIVPSGFTVNDDMTVANNKAVVVENRIEAGKPGITKALVEVTKEVNGLYKTDGHDAATRFGIEVKCNGTTLADFNLLDGWTASVEGEVGQTCTIREPSVPATKVPGTYKYIITSITPSDAVLTSDGIDATVTNTVDLNSVNTRQVTLTNAVTGDLVPSVFHRNQPFVVTLNCGTGPYDFGEVATRVGEKSTFAVPGGATCAMDTVTTKMPGFIDPAKYEWYRDTYNPSPSFVANNDTDATVTHALREIGTVEITVKKTVTGVSTSGTFTIHVVCGSDHKDMSLSNGGTDTLWARQGSTCTITEDDLPGVNSTAVIAPAGFVAKGPQTVLVTNRTSNTPVQKATLTVTKTVTGNLAVHNADNAFGIRVVCATTPVADLTLLENQYATVEGELGQVCTITEPTIPTLTSPYKYAPNISPSKETLLDDVDVAVENEVTDKDTHLVILTNAVDGPEPTEYNQAEKFGLKLECGAGISKTSSMYVGGESSYSIPDGVNCTVTPTARPTPNTTPTISYQWVDSETTYSLGSPFLTKNVDETEVVTHWLDKVIGDVDCTTTTVVANPLTVDANGTSTSVITVTLRDANGLAIPDPTAVSFSLPGLNYGSFPGNQTTASCQTNATGTCQVTYTSPNAIPPGATGVTVTAQIAGVTCTPAKTAYIAFGESQNQTVTVKKTVEGTGYTGQPFTINVDCGAGYSKVMSLVHGAQDSIVVPIGNTCSISEVEPGAGIIGANNTNTSVIAPWNFTVVKGQDQTVQITNRISNEIIPKGVLNISKHIAGDSSNVDNGHISANEFTINVTCTGTNPATFTLKGGQSAKVEAKLGATCTTDEPAPLPTAKPGYLYAANVSPAVILDLTASRDVTVTNSVEVDDGTPYHWVSLKNVVAGDPALFNNNGMFKLAVGCGTFYEEPEMRVNEESHYSVKQGATCNVSTISRAPLLNTTLWSWGTTTYSPSASFAVNNATNAVATHPIVRTELRTVTVTKTVNDGTGAYTNGKFSINVNCGTGYTKAMTLAGGETDSIDVPINRSCTITEAEPAATVIGAGNSNITTISPSEFTVKDYNDEIKVAVTNRISSVPVNKATLKVTKEVTGTEKSNGHIDGNTFGIVVECTGLLATTLNLQDGWSGTVQGTVGQRCAITEPNLASAPAAKPNYKYVANNTGTVTLQPDVGATPGTQVTVQNMVVPSNVTFHLVSLTNALTADSPTTAYNQGQPFVLTMNCGTGTDYVWNDISGYIGDTTDRSVPAGSTCTMGTASRPTTSATHKWDLGYGVNGTAYNPASGFTVNTAMTETATHRIIPSEMRTIEVVKHVTGGTTASVFAIHVSCNDGAGGAFAPKPVMNLAAGGSSSFQAMDGTYCEVTEDKISIGGVDGYTALIVPSGFTVNDDMTVANNKAVVVENRIEAGKPGITKALVEVTKEVNGLYKTDGHDAATRFGIEVKCNGTTLADFNLLDGWTASVEGEVGQTCTIREPSVPATKVPGTYKYIITSITPSDAVLTSDGIDATVTNTVDLNSVNTRQVTLTNAVTGDLVPSVFHRNQPFVVTLNCGTGPYDFGEVATRVGEKSTFAVPGGATCAMDTVTTKMPGFIDPAKYEWYRDTYNPSPSFVANNDTDATVTHALREIGTVEITVKKTVTGVSTSGTFTIHVVCGSDHKDMSLSNGGTDTLWARQGSTCTITEDDLPGVNSTAVIAPAGFVAKGPQTVLVTNRTSNTPVQKATLTVTKTVTGNLAVHNADNAFGIRVVCATTPVADLTLLENQYATVEGELGQVCTITEPTIPTLTSPYKYAPNISPSSLTLLDDTDVTVENWVTDRPTHLVVLTNAVGGPTPTEFDHNGKFGLTLDCGVGFNKSSSMRVGDKASYSVPDNTYCTVTTTTRPAPNSLNEWDSSKDTYSLSADKGPQGRFTTQPVDETEVVTHWLQRIGDAPVTVVKTLTGNTALYTSGTFDVTLVCTSGFSETFHFAPTGTETRMVPIGDTCTITVDTVNAVLSGGTPRRIVAPNQFMVGDNGQTVNVETELLDAPIPRAPLYVTKAVTGTAADITNGHDPAAVFGITVSCPGTSSTVKTLNLENGQSGMADAMVGDVCTVSEPTVPTAKFGYQYELKSIIPSSLSISTAGRSAEVVNLIRPIGTASVRFTFTQATVTDAPGSGYVPGILNTTVNCGAGGVFSLPLAEGEQATVAVPSGTVCTSATMGAMPPLTSGFHYSGPTMTPPLPYTARQGDNVDIRYVISPPAPPQENLPIPALDPKALLLLIGLLAGAMFWQVRQPKRRVNR